MNLEEYFREDENLAVVTLAEFKNFKEKMNLTKKYRGKAHVEIIDDRYIYIMKLEGEDHGGKINQSQNLQEC